MFPKVLAIVDVETTGQSAAYGRIIEIAVLRVEEGRIVKTFQTLVNPERYVSPMIEGLTGISNDDVARAPVFAEISRGLMKILDGAVFVAHNASFDYSFVRNEFRALGIVFSARCLCTVKLSRKLYPQYRHHDLSSVIQRHAIPVASRHRAMGDVRAVHEFLSVVARKEDPARVQAVVNEILKTNALLADI